jgi:hypothetical protein
VGKCVENACALQGTYDQHISFSCLSFLTRAKKVEGQLFGMNYIMQTINIFKYNKFPSSCFGLFFPNKQNEKE